MKEIFRDFCKLFGNSLTIVCFMLASFLLLINLYHYKEVTYTYNVDMSTNVKYNEFKNSVSSIEKKLNDFNASGSNNIKVVINSCITTLKNTSFYSLEDDKAISQKDVYDMNLELYDDVHNKCLFYLGYDINHLLEKNGKSDSFADTYSYLQEQRSYILDVSDYIKDRSLSNSTYSYVTDITRSSIFNETAADLSLTINNYIAVANVVDNVTNWYINQYGGAR